MSMLSPIDWCKSAFIELWSVYELITIVKWDVCEVKKNVKEEKGVKNKFLCANGMRKYLTL